MEKLSFKLEVFEGPLDLLLFLIQKNKVSIYDIPVSLITEQYMEYLKLMETHDLEISSEFLVMAARLLYIKSKMLLPKHEELEGEEEEDPRQELILNLVEYKKYKEVSKFFSDRKNICDFLYFKNSVNTDDFKINVNAPMEVDALTKAFEKVMKRFEDKLPPSKMLFSGMVGREPVSVKSKMKSVTTALRISGQVSFDDLFTEAQSRSEIVAIFLAVLELVRNNEVGFESVEGRIVLSSQGE